MNELYTTLRLLADNGACSNRYTWLANALGGADAYGMDTPIPLRRILETNGYNDVVWAFIAVPPEQKERRDRIARLHACDCASAMPLGNGRTLWDLLSQDLRAALEVARQFAQGRATREQLLSADESAWSAVDHAYVIGTDAWMAARAAAWAVSEYAPEALRQTTYASLKAAAHMGNGEAGELWRTDNLRGWLNNE